MVMAELNFNQGRIQMSWSTTAAVEPPRVIGFPLQAMIAWEHTVAAVEELKRGNINIDTSIEHLGPYAGRVEWLRQQVMITRGRP